MNIFKTKLYSYTIDNYSLIKLAVDVWEWQSYRVGADLSKFLTKVPTDVMDGYFAEFELFKGLTTVKIGGELQIESEDFTSWTTDINVAKEFSCIESNIEHTYDKYNELDAYAVVIKKTGKGINLGLLAKDLGEWVVQNLDDFSNYLREDKEYILKWLHENEKEVISPLLISDIEVIKCDPVTI